MLEIPYYMSQPHNITVYFFKYSYQKLLSERWRGKVVTPRSYSPSFKIDESALKKWAVD